MTYKRLTKKHIVLIVAVIAIVIAGIIAFFVFRSKSELSNKPNPSPGSGKTASPASRQAEAKKLSQTKELNKMLAEAPKDPKTRCVITAKFNAEQRRDEQISAENKRNDEYIKKFGNNKSNEYIHKQNLDKIQKQYDREIKNIKCK